LIVHFGALSPEAKELLGYYVKQGPTIKALTIGL
jgi:hypothetical protein